MQVSHRFTPDSAVFDEDNLVSCAGLVPVMTHGIAYKDRLPVASFTKPTASAWTYL